MRIHVIIDFMHIYYKYFFQLKAGKLKRLSAAVETNGTTVQKETTLIYYPLKDIEGIRHQFEQNEHDVTVSVCMDSRSKRKDDDTDGASAYKSGRKKNLSDNDLENLDLIEKALREAGHNVYKEEGYEADDLVSNLVTNYKNDFDCTIIYTNDKDLFVNIDDTVGVMRFKNTVGYTRVLKSNYEYYLENEFGVRIPYNSIGLFLATVGDTADKIKGINKFGVKAFEKLIDKLESENDIDWSVCGDYAELRKVADLCKKYLTETQYEQMNDSFELVRNSELGRKLDKPEHRSTKELRIVAYEKYQMHSLIF
jgi:5'-3' exonuclease